MKILQSVLVLVIGCISFFSHAQDFEPVVVKSFSEEMTIDGVLDEDIWAQAAPSKDFWQYFPSDTSLAVAQSEIYLATDGKNLYVGIKCYGAGNDWIVRDLKRDFRAGGTDAMTIVFDTFDDQTNAIFFGINPEGVIREGVVTNGGNQFRDFSESWDNKWRGEAKKFDGYYTAEMEIPFSTLRYKEGGKKWGFLAYRFDTQDNERSTSVQIPRNQPLFSLAYTKPMIWEAPIPSAGSNIVAIPFVAGSWNKDYEAGTDAETSADMGGDLKVAVTSGLNLDVTVNPDFSQVEVDRQITNLDRFEIFFPERRQFFIENADLFSSFGFSRINPFFSRRIGVGTDANTGVTTQNRILGGLRLSGKLDSDTRLGLLNMQTVESIEKGLPSINYSVAAVQRKIWDRSNVGFIFVNKQSFGDQVVTNDLSKFNRIAGLDFNYASTDNIWNVKTFLHTSMSPDASAKMAHGAQLTYNTRELEVGWSHEYVQEDYRAETGFIRRTDYIQIDPSVTWKFYPKGIINRISVGPGGGMVWRPGFGKTDHELGLSVNGSFSSGARFNMGMRHSFVHLFSDFDPTGTDSTPLLAGTSYNYVNFTGNINTDMRKPFGVSIRPYIGQYFNGTRYSIGGDITFRYPPRGSVQLNYSWNTFDMPHLEETKQTLLIGPRIDYTFSKKLFATAFIQYNSQSKNTNINTRLQWRFAPVSDFFLVFTDNYYTGNDPFDVSDRFAINVTNRAIVAKLTYWINV